MFAVARMLRLLIPVALVSSGVFLFFRRPQQTHVAPPLPSGTLVYAGLHDISPAFGSLASEDIATGVDPDHRANSSQPPSDEGADAPKERGVAVITSPFGANSVEQTVAGTKTAARLITVVEGAGSGFTGPHGNGRGGLDYSVAVGPNHIVEIVNSGGIHIWTKRGLPDKQTKKPMYGVTGTPLYGPANVRTVWKGFGGQCDTRGSGDAVVRYDQLADRWLIVVPLFSRYPHIEGQMPYPEIGVTTESRRGQQGQPSSAVKLDPPDTIGTGGRRGGAPNAGAPAGQGARVGTPPDSAARARAAAAAAARPNRYPDGTAPPGDTTQGTYGMCYAVSTTPDPLGTYYRYEFIRPFFPDYPRPAIWPDGYYIPTSTSDDFIQKHACVADRVRMLKGEDATEQCIIINGIPFLNMADLDGKTLPPPGAPMPVLAAGGSQLRGVLEDSVIYSWNFHVDWNDPKKTALVGPVLIPVAPYHFLCDGQLKQCVPQPENNTRLDSQGDKLMARVTYRRIGNVEHVIAGHSVNNSMHGGGLRWYEFRVRKDRGLDLYQQGTYTPGTAADSLYRWVPSAAMDKFGNIGIAYSYGGMGNHAGIRFTGRQLNDPKGKLTFAETIIENGAGSQTASRFEDYTQSAIDPDDDCTFWHVGAYVRAGSTAQASKVSALRMPGCK